MPGSDEGDQNVEQQPRTFEENLASLEGIVEKLEEGNLPLEQSLKLYQQGVAAYQQCQQSLREAEVKVSKLVETLEGELKEQPFESPQQ